MPDNKSCFIHTLRLIDTLQRRNTDELNCDNTCSKPFLGDGDGLVCFNTRPVTFYRCDNTLVSVDVEDEPQMDLTSSVFRVERVHDTCVVCRILVPRNTEKKEETLNGAFAATNQTTIINLDCICAIKCLADTFICL